MKETDRRLANFSTGNTALSQHSAGTASLENLIADPALEEVWVNGPDQVFVAEGGVSRSVPMALTAMDIRGSDAQADYSRSLVDKAGKAEVQMLVPMVLLILPITVIFAVYPGMQALNIGI